MTRYQSILNAADILITPNRRLATYLRKQYNQTQKTAVFNSADILPLNAWLSRLYETALLQQWTDKILLTTEQEFALWEQIIQQQSANTVLLSKSHKTAQLAQKAWELVHYWQLPISALEHSHFSETEQFLAWLNAFKKMLYSQNWLTLTELPVHLSQQLPTSYCQSLSSLQLVGFDEIPPAVQSFLDCLIERGVDIVGAGPCARPNRADTGVCPYGEATIYKLNCKNNLEELTLALHYAQSTLKKNSEARIGIVFPELVQQRSTIIALCQKQFYTDNFFQEPEANPWINISGSIPLSDTVLLQSIFTVLKLKTHHIATPDLYWLWHSPYFNFGAYEDRRPILAERLSQEYNKYISHNTLMRFLHQQCALQDKNELTAFYTALKAPPSHNPSAKSHHTWAQIIHRYLLALGFPGKRSLASSDVQRINAFEEVLQSFASLDQITEKVSFEDALTQLQYLCQQKLFQAKTHDAPIQILGLLEASGLEYTHLWITGLNEGVFPSYPQPHSLLPIPLQKKYALPHADSQREFDFAQKLLTRLFTHSDFVICSYSEENNDVHLRPSPLIATLPLFNKTLLPVIEEKFPTPLKTEYMDDSLGLSLAADSKVRGGSYLFKLQAQCPFKAYASLRLQAEESGEPGLGLSPISRGNMVHVALQYFYQTISSQSQLLSLSKEEQYQLLQKACQNALAHLHEQQLPSENPSQYRLEQARLEKLLTLWLEQERARPHFTVIATEKRLEVHFADLQFTVQIDRIDRLDDGGEILIDYKTGAVSIQDWFSERPNEPQMPLYCSLYDGDIKALLFAKVHLQKMGLEGVGDLNTDWPAIQRLSFTTLEGGNPWQQQKALWRQQLTALAEEFKQGYAAVTPKEGACEHCHLPTLCRVHLQQNGEHNR